MDNAEEFHRLDDLLAPLEPESRREIALMVAQASITLGKTAAAAMAAERVLATAPIGSLDADRARLYRAAAQAASAQDCEAADAELATIAPDRLSTEDRRLLGSARAVARAISGAADVEVIAGRATEPQAPDAAGMTLRRPSSPRRRRRSVVSTSCSGRSPYDSRHPSLSPAVRRR
ncbi:hypothetical protein ACFSKM_17035 [Ancylobacter dichloromethanicus]